MELRRTIWTYWHQGYDAAPEVVKACAESWRVHNPGWELAFLDQHSVIRYVDLASIMDLGRSDLTLQKISAMTRLCLLKQHGGVWVDATVFCTWPLERWLPEYMTTGFFAFRNPHRDRLMSNWFIAAERENLLLRELQRAFMKLYADNRFTHQETAFGKFAVRKLSRILNVNPRRTRYWLSAPVLKLLRVYPYFVFHYVFNKLIQDDPACRAVWESGRPYDAKDPVRVLHMSRRRDSLEEALHFIERDATPVHKLSWRVRMNKQYWTRVLPILQERTRIAARPDASQAEPTIGPAAGQVAPS